MRGEEVQLLGAAAVGMVPPDSLLCQPGTHCKWAWMKNGALADFVTAMTGELFALLKEHALIGQEMIGAVAEPPEGQAGDEHHHDPPDTDGERGDRKSTRLNSSHKCESRLPSSA